MVLRHANNCKISLITFFEKAKDHRATLGCWLSGR